MDTEQQQKLIAEALAVRLRAYAPYSNYLVGAAVLTQSGSRFAGCNVENASYGLTICAERAAIFQAVAAGFQQLKMIAIAATQKVTPCGACLQVMAEFSDDLLILLVDPSNPTVVSQRTLNELLPQRFKSVKR